MNSDTGHIVRGDLFEEMKRQGTADGYEPLPPELWKAAERKLGRKAEGHVSRTSGGKLSRHAAANRQKKRASRRSMEKATRKANRGR